MTAGVNNARVAGVQLGCTESAHWHSSRVHLPGLLLSFGHKLRAERARTRILLRGLVLAHIPFDAKVSYFIHAALQYHDPDFVDVTCFGLGYLFRMRD